jgi:hypothetical protein
MQNVVHFGRFVKRHQIDPQIKAKTMCGRTIAKNHRWQAEGQLATTKFAGKQCLLCREAVELVKELNAAA